MKLYIKKVNDNLIVITISEEELCFDYDLYIEDLVNPNKREIISKKLIQIVHEVSSKENISIKNGMQLEVTLNEKHELVLTVNFVPEFNLNNLHGIAKYIKTAIHNKTKEEADDIMQKIFASLNLSVDKMDEVLDEMNCIECEDIEIPIEEISKEELLYILKTNSLDNCIELSKTINKAITESTLYKLKDEYYLVINILPNTDEFILGTSSEFLFQNLHSMSVSFLDEHGQVIIKNDAVKNLATI